MSSQYPATLNLSLEVLADHGGHSGPYTDGWGIVYYDDRDIVRIRDARPAWNNPWVDFIERQSLASQLVIAQIRRASQGSPATKNTQPFCRELGGRVHTFVHNGNLPDLAATTGSPTTNYLPIGETDSELAFCMLLERLRGEWLGKEPSLERRMGVISEFAEQLRCLGNANFIYSDGEYLFAHGHQRQPVGSDVIFPGLAWLCRRCEGSREHVEGAGLRVHAPDQHVALVASVPLTEERWQFLAGGEIAVFRDGRPVAVS